MNDGEINVMIIILLRMSYNSSQLLKLNSPLPLRGRDESALDAIAAPLKSMILLGFSLWVVFPRSAKIRIETNRQSQPIQWQ